MEESQFAPEPVMLLWNRFQEQKHDWLAAESTLASAAPKLAKVLSSPVWRV